MNMLLLVCGVEMERRAVRLHGMNAERNLVEGARVRKRIIVVIGSLPILSGSECRARKSAGNRGGEMASKKTTAKRIARKVPAKKAEGGKKVAAKGADDLLPRLTSDVLKKPKGGTEDPGYSFVPVPKSAVRKKGKGRADDPGRSVVGGK
jgi:hypothetical protein